MHGGSDFRHLCHASNVTVPLALARHHPWRRYPLVNADAPGSVAQKRKGGRDET